MVTDRYVPHPVPSWETVVAEKDREIAELREKVRRLEALVYAQERQQHVDMGR
jgi:hypothetical protein